MYSPVGKGKQSASAYTYSPPKATAKWPENNKPIVKLNEPLGQHGVVLEWPNGLIPRWTVHCQDAMKGAALSCENGADAVALLTQERDSLMEVDGVVADSLTAAQLTLVIDTMRGLVSLTFETDYKTNDIVLKRGCTLLFVMMLVGAVRFFAVDAQGELHAMLLPHPTDPSEGSLFLWVGEGYILSTQAGIDDHMGGPGGDRTNLNNKLKLLGEELKLMFPGRLGELPSLGAVSNLTTTIGPKSALFYKTEFVTKMQSFENFTTAPAGGKRKASNEAAVGSGE